MATIAKCLREIRAVREVADGQEVPYVARSRVARLGLSVARLTSGLAGTTPPDRPGKVSVPREVDGVVGEVMQRGHAIHAISEFIRQPSEPLDSRWLAMWDDLSRHLSALEQLLRRLDGSPAPVLIGGKSTRDRHGRP